MLRLKLIHIYKKSHLSGFGYCQNIVVNYGWFGSRGFDALYLTQPIHAIGLWEIWW